MQYIKNGPDIPDELIEAQQKSEVIFICGAGVSINSGLPDFKGLVSKIYESLDLDIEQNQAEKLSFDKGQYDKVLFLLERRLTNGRKRIEAEVNSILGKSPTCRNIHNALLTLSRDGNNEPYLITTNFDEHFEKCNPKIPSLSPQALIQFPPPAGIIHLHGKIREEGMVLTFADTSDAYLQSGWAKRFLNKVARWKSIVFVGFSGEDPYFQLLMAAISQDRKWAKGMPSAYAFSSNKEKILWDMFDVEVIEYTSNDAHSLLNETLIEWVHHANDKSAWEENALRYLLQKKPAEHNELEKNQFEFLITEHGKIPDGTNPFPEWWSTIKTLQLPPDSIIPWVMQNLENPDMVKAFVKHPIEGTQFISKFEDRFIEQERKIKEPYRQAWKLLIHQAKQYRLEDMEYFDKWCKLKQRMQNGEYGSEVIDGIVKVITPTLNITPPLSLYDSLSEQEEEQNNNMSLYDLMRCEFRTSSYIKAREILQAWTPTDSQETLRLCRRLTERMVEMLEFAQEQRIDWTVYIPSIEQHSQNRCYKDGFYQIVRLTTGIWQTLDKEYALKISSRWRERRNINLMQRMFLYALTEEKEWFPAKEAADELLNMDEKIFWGLRSRGSICSIWVLYSGGSVKKEIATLLEKHWDEFPQEQKGKLEEKILKGPPREKFESLPQEKADEYHEVEILEKLRAIKNLSEETQKRKLELEKKHPNHPEWQTKFNEFDHGIFRGDQGDPEELDALPAEKRIEKARELQRVDFDQHDIWLKYCRHDPRGALEALKAEAQKQEWPEAKWRHFFWTSDTWKNFNFEEESKKQLIADVAEAIKGIPDKNLVLFVDSPASWFRNLLTHFDEKQRLSLWHKMMGALELRDESNEPPDAYGVAINRAEGKLTEVVFSWCGSRNKNQGFEDKIRPLMDKLVSLGGYSGALVRATMMPFLDYLYHTEPDWTEKHILPWLKESHPMRWALWDGYKYNKYLPREELFNKMKPDILTAIDADNTNEDGYGESNIKHRLIYTLIQILFFRQEPDYALEAKEIRQRLRKVDDETRCNVLRNLRHGLGSQTDKDKKESIIKCFFEQVWPLDAEFIEGSLNEMFFFLTRMEDSFPAALEATKGFLRPMKDSSQFYNLEHANLHQRFPEDVLTLLDSVIGKETRIRDYEGDKIKNILDSIVESRPDLKQDNRYQRLRRYIRH